MSLLLCFCALSVLFRSVSCAHHISCTRSNGYGKQVPIAFHVASDIVDAIITDEEWLWQMLLNLLTNACKYTDKGSIQVMVKLSADVNLPSNNDGGGDALLFEVIDTGR
jgi:signal transduction histidine kinase